MQREGFSKFNKIYEFDFNILGKVSAFMNGCKGIEKRATNSQHFVCRVCPVLLGTKFSPTHTHAHTHTPHQYY